MTKNRIDMLIDKNAVVDKGNGLVEFKGGLTLSDESVQKNGTRYDIKTMDIETWDGTVFADHDYSVQAVIGNAVGVAKKGKRLVAQGVQFAVDQSPLAAFVHSMVVAGFIKAVSIGTLGRIDWVEDDQNEEAAGIYRNSRLIEFSFVGIGNNDNAKVNAIAKNVFERAESEGLDTKDLKEYLEHNEVTIDDVPTVPVKPPKESEDTDTNNNKGTDMTIVTVKNGREFAVEISYKNAAGDTVKTELAPGATVDVAEEQKNAVEKQLTDAAAPKVEKNETDVAELVKNAVADQVKSLADELAVYKEAFDKGAKEPEFIATANGLQEFSGQTLRLNKEGFESMDWRELTGLQIQKAWESMKQGDTDAAATYHKINKFNKEQLIAKGIAKNSLSPSDFGNFVTNPELITQIVGYRSDYSELLSTFGYGETNSLSMAWLNRTGDIDMQPVGMWPTDADADANLKPISEYGATPTTKDLEELAAVTPVANATTIFLAADLVEDATQGYRHSYDRNLARGIVAAFQTALEAGAATQASLSTGYNVSGTQTPQEKLEDIRLAVFAISQGNGVLVMNEASWGYIWSLLSQTGNGAAITEIIQNGVAQKTLWTKRVVVTPNELLPTLGASDYKSFMLDGGRVDVTHALFYVNPTNFRGRQHGGLAFDLSTEAAYEEADGTVKSAYQRNELVLRGSHFRGTAVLDTSRVAGVRSQNLLVS